MAKKKKRPMWSGKLGDERIACMVKHGTPPGDMEEMWLICSCLMTGLLRGGLLQGMSVEVLDEKIDHVAASQKECIRDLTILEGLVVTPDNLGTIIEGTAVMSDGAIEEAIVVVPLKK